MHDYSDTDPIEAKLFSDFQAIAVATTKGELDSLASDIRSVDSLIPT
jgi:hypothetical protein